MLANARNPENAKFEGKTIAEIATLWNKEPADAAWDLVAQGSGRVMAIYHMMSEADMETALGFPWTSIGSDAGAALRPGGQDRPACRTRGLRQLSARDRALRERARRADARAGDPQDDVVAGDADATRRSRRDPRRLLGRRRDLRLRRDCRIAPPTTSQCLSPAGIDYVLVNGVVIDHDRHTGARPGKVILGPGRAVTP